MPFDLSGPLGLEVGPATSPALLASFVRIAAADEITTAPVATSELFHVIAGSGTSIVDGTTLDWAAGDFFVLPSGCRSSHRATTNATLYWVTDEPLLRFLGVAPTSRRFQPTHFPAQRVQAELAAIEASPHSTDRNRMAVVLNTAAHEQAQTATHVLWAMWGKLPTGAVQRPHRHQSVALDLVVACQPGCYTLIGRSIDASGEIVDPTRVDWEPHGAFVTPPGLWHAHYNESSEAAWFVPVQDAGLHTYLRSLDIRFAPPAR